MEAIANITARIGQIQHRIDSLTGANLQARSMLATQTVLATQTATSAAAIGGTQPGSAAAFSAVLDQAVATHAGAAPGAGATSTVGQVDAKGIPLELKQYGNGRIPDHALSPIGGTTNHTLWAPAARSFEAMRAAAERDGVTIGITDSYRTYASQVDVAQRKGLYSQGGLAAVPGTSDHGWGIAVDLRLDSKAQAWMRANAKDYGYVEDVPREPWHWAFKPHAA